MNLKEKLADAHNNFPIIESHPALLYAEALNRIIELEEAIKYATDYLDKPLNQIGYGSKAHRELLEAIKE